MLVTRRRALGLGVAAGVTCIAARGSGLAIMRAQAAPADDAARVTSVDGLLALDLVASVGWVDLAGRSARLWSYNGRVPGPTLEVSPGDELRIRLVNQLDEGTNLHFHGLHVPPDGPADDVFRELAPGDDGAYALHIPEQHPEGLYWVHPHRHGAVARQVSLGLALPLIVRGALDRVPEVAAAREHVLVLQDFELDASGRPIQPGTMTLMAGREGSSVTASGQSRPRIALERDGALRLRLLNASASRFYRLSLDGHPMHVIATDGGRLARPQAVDELLLAPGERRDVLILGQREAGTHRLMNLPYDRGTTGMMGGAGGAGAPFEVASIVYDGRALSPVSLPTSLGDELERLSEPRVRRTFVLSEGMGMMMGRSPGMRFLINGREFDHTRVDDRVRLGDVEEWEYVNTTTMDHPMHVHTNAFQRLGADGEPEPAWLDGVVVPARGRVRIRLRFADFAGLSVQHCHILDHEDLGMMSSVSIE